MSRASLAEKSAELASALRRDVRTIRKAIEIGDRHNAVSILLHVLVLADELAPPPPPAPL